jgi:hypothetical protein
MKARHCVGSTWPADPCLTYSDINSALDALNNGFDECRTVCACTP